MNAVGQVAALIAALIHVYIFVLESVLFPRPSARKNFGVTEAELPAVRPWAFNQGFYNLFLAAGALGGVVLAAGGGTRTTGSAIALFSCLCMIAAAVVLFSTDRRMVRAAAIQAGPALVAVVLAAIL